jgi:hypothetical protein
VHSDLEETSASIAEDLVDHPDTAKPGESSEDLAVRGPESVVRGEDSVAGSQDRGEDSVAGSAGDGQTSAGLMDSVAGKA